MAYSDFSLTAAKSAFGLEVRERPNLFPAPDPPIVLSAVFQEVLRENLTFARNINTEKARSEFIIAPVMSEIRKQLNHQISIFSGNDFSVDALRGLTGRCDFLISLSPLQLAIEAPVVSVVEVKNEDVQGGLGQCIAEMVASHEFNQHQGKPVPTLYGAVTTGLLWRFLSLQNDAVAIAENEFYIFDDVNAIVGILVGMVREAQTHAKEWDTKL